MASFKGATLSHDTNQGKFLNHCVLKRFVKDSPVPEEVVKPILCFWDHEKDFASQAPSVLDEVEKLLGYENISWPSDIKRALFLLIKVDQIFHQLLYDHGYLQICYSTSDHKRRLEASPKPGTVPKELPDWLNTPYLCVLPAQDWSERHENCTNSTLRFGDVFGQIN